MKTLLNGTGIFPYTNKKKQAQTNSSPIYDVGVVNYGVAAWRSGGGHERSCGVTPAIVPNRLLAVRQFSRVLSCFLYIVGLYFDY